MLRGCVSYHGGRPWDLSNVFFRVCTWILGACPERSEFVFARESVGLSGTVSVTDAPSSDMVMEGVVWDVCEPRKAWIRSCEVLCGGNSPFAGPLWRLDQSITVYHVGGIKLRDHIFCAGAYYYSSSTKSARSAPHSKRLYCCLATGHSYPYIRESCRRVGIQRLSRML